MSEPTLEKDIDVTGDRDIGIGRSSQTGTDDKSSQVTRGVANDVGADEAVSAALAGSSSLLQMLNATLMQQVVRAGEQSLRVVEQTMQQANETFTARMDAAAELRALRLRTLSGANDLTAVLHESTSQNVKAVNAQAQRGQDIAMDREWNVDEQVAAAVQILRDSGVSSATTAAITAAVLADVANKKVQ